MNDLVSLLLLAALASNAAAQCTGSDHPSCTSWQRNGYCTNTAVETVKKSCGVTCGLCTLNGFQTALGGGDKLSDCADANANCASWQTNNKFCSNPVNSNAIKLQYCCRTCRPYLMSTTTSTTTVKPINGCPALTPIDQAKLDARYPPAGSKKCGTPEMTATGSKCSDPALPDFVLIQSDGVVNGWPEMDCENGDWQMVSFIGTKESLKTSIPSGTTSVCCLK